MLITSNQSRSSARQRGFTLIELMVGMVIGLIVLSTAIAIYLMAVRGGAYALRAAKLNQEMRTGMTLMVEDIRRAGYWGNFQQDTPNPFTNRIAPTVPTDPPVTDIHILPFNGRANACILYSYDATYQAGNVSGNPDQVADPGTDFFGFRLTADGALQMRHGGNMTNACEDNLNWERITDPGTVEITALSFDTIDSQCMNVTAISDEERITIDIWRVRNNADDSTVPACEDMTTYTPPPTYIAPIAGDRLIELRQINIRMVARHVNDAEMRATLEQSVKVRNDRVFTF